MQRAGMIQNNRIFFNPWETIHEGNPQEIIERREAVTLPPLLIMQGALDDNVLPAIQEKFAATYRAAGASVSFTCSRAANTSGSPNRGPKPTAPADGEGLHRAAVGGVAATETLQIRGGDEAAPGELTCAAWSSASPSP